MKKYLSKVIAIFLATLIVFSMTCAAFAATSIPSSIPTISLKDYASLSQLNSDYSYGTLFFSDDTEIINTTTSTSGILYKSSGLPSGTTNAWASTGNAISGKITNCAVDKDGDICDAVFTVNSITNFSTAATSNTSDFESVFGTQSSVYKTFITIRNYYYVSKGYNSTGSDSNVGIKYNSPLIVFNFNANRASADFTLTYYKAGTSTKANIPGTASMIYDIDVPITTSNGNVTSSDTNEIFGGNEGIAPLYNSSIYYATSGSNHYLRGATNSSSRSYGVRTNDSWYNTSSTPYYGTSGIHEATSCFVVQDNASVYKMRYSGRICGITYLFVSPSAYLLDNPTKAVSSTSVFEKESYNYTIKQYVPNNYYASIVSFIGDTTGIYSSFAIQDQLDGNLVVDTSSVKVTNEDNDDVTSKFAVSIDSDNLLKITPTADFLKNVNFYAHYYTIKFNVYAKEGAGKSKGTITNIATTQAVLDGTTTTKSTNTVSTSLKYNVAVNAQIDNGSVYINNGDKDISVNTAVVVNYGDSLSNKVYFQPTNGYKVSSVLLNGEEISPDELIETNCIYSYIFNDNNIAENIEHNIIVNTVLKDASVIVNYLDESGNKIADSENLSGKIFDKYSTQTKDIYGYELTTIPVNASGSMTEDTIIVNYIYKLKDTSVIVKHIDSETGKVLCADEIINGKVFDEYKTSSKEFGDYDLVSEPTNASGTMTEKQIEVDYYYVRQAAVVIVNYMDENGVQLYQSATFTGKVGDTYTTEEKTFYGYSLTQIPDNALGSMTVDTVTVNYIYFLNSAKVIVNYLDASNNPLADTITISGKYFEPYDTSEKDIYGYELISIPENNKGTMEQDLTIVNYIYRLKNTSVRAIYIDEDENELTDSINIDGKVFDEYSTEVKEFIGYELTEVPDNAEGVMTEDTIVVRYIYKLVPSPVIDNEKPEVPIEPNDPEIPEAPKDSEIPETTTKTPVLPDEPEKPKTVVYQAHSPKTGDRTNIILYFIGMVLSLAGLILLTRKIKKSKLEHSTI